MAKSEPERAEGWKERRANAQAAKGALARAEMDEITGRNLSAEVVPATDADLVGLAVLFVGCLAENPPHLRDWFKMYARVDDDGSGTSRPSPPLAHGYGSAHQLGSAWHSSQRILSHCGISKLV